MRPARSNVLFSLAALSLGACTTTPLDPPTPPPTSTEVSSSKPRDTQPLVSSTDLRALTDGNTAFAFDLYQRLRAEGGNLFYSPYSISIALAMTWAGARGMTADQMQAVFHYPSPWRVTGEIFDALDLALASRGQNSQGADGKPFKLSVANAVWGQSGGDFVPDYLDYLAQDYGAGLRVVDFMTAPEPSRVAINSWVSDQTSGRIPDLLPPGSITMDTRFVLTDAVYFNASWQQPFDVHATKDGTFHALDGSTQPARMMSTNLTGVGYAAGDGWQAAAIPYDGDQLSMVIIAPDAGRFAEIEAALDGKKVGGVLAALSRSGLALTLPQWKTEASTSLARTLSAMGMPLAFGDGADFSGIDGQRDLSISEIFHKAWITVDESGTEAAAATAVVVGTDAAFNQHTLTVDRPFIYLIRDDATGAVLFVGRMVSLTQ